MILSAYVKDYDVKNNWINQSCIQQKTFVDKNKI